MKHNGWAFLKFGEPPHMRALLRGGEFYCNTIGYFQGHERDQLRGDPAEGASHAWQLSTHQLWVAHQLIADPEGRLEIAPNAHRRVNLYCFYSLRPHSAHIDPRNFEFGASCIYIRDPAALLHRIEKALNKAPPRGCKVVRVGPVTYVNRKTHDGKMGPFRKFDEFRHQSEFRLVIEPGIGKPMTFNVGSIEDIAQYVDAKDINRYFGLRGPLPKVG